MKNKLNLRTAKPKNSEFSSAVWSSKFSTPGEGGPIKFHFFITYFRPGKEGPPQKVKFQYFVVR